MTQLHKTEPIFVGRKDELKRFGEILASPKGQAVLVVGPQGMGKTLLVNKMARSAQKHLNLKCYETPYQAEACGSGIVMIVAHPVGNRLLKSRDEIERAFGQASTISFGYKGLPAWARRIHRASRWMWAKNLIHQAWLLKRDQAAPKPAARSVPRLTKHDPTGAGVGCTTPRHTS